MSGERGTGETPMSDSDSGYRYWYQDLGKTGTGEIPMSGRLAPEKPGPNSLVLVPFSLAEDWVGPRRDTNRHGSSKTAG